MISQEHVLDLVHQCLPKFSGTTSFTKVAAADIKVTTLCSLWSGMGHIYKVSLWKGKYELIIKHVAPPSPKRQSFGDRRKADSYQVEAIFYEALSSKLIREHQVNIPTPYLVTHGPAPGEITVCMSLLEGKDVDTSDLNHAHAVLTWLARLHSSYFGKDRIDQLVNDLGLQFTGGYWYLDTRPDEHDSMPRSGWEGRLKRAARAIDECLKRDPMQCLIHGDAKEANILVQASNNDDTVQVAMYDFQYCGKGTPTRDLAYFLCSSCCDDNETELVEYYYNRLVEFLPSDVTPPTLEHLRISLELAFCDYCRFMAGWGYWGCDIRGRVKTFLDRLDGGKDLGSEEAYDKAIRRELW
jgi:hypothetical protein